ncbi:hypothetical protein F5B19DRAFT_434431 [Rostrohypoxylon terebratum]|nr:hypothetical protein F5B19DRAFT_434431 [Rostrohypoxylon terebratum]
MDYLANIRQKDVGILRNAWWNRNRNRAEFHRVPIVKKEDSISTHAVTSSSESSLIESNANDNSDKFKDTTNRFPFKIKIILDFIRLYDKITDGVRSGPPGDDRLDQAEVDGAGADGGGGSNTHANSGISTQNPTSSSSAFNKRQGNSKRQRDKEREDHPNRGGGKRSSVSRGVDDPGRRFACIFYHSDNTRHWHCQHLTLKRIGDVRQHIWRKHACPVHCPTCGEEFHQRNPNQRIAARNEHINTRSCQERDFPKFWATEDMLDQMVNAANETNSYTDEERWYIIWDIMFPGRARPPSPYIDNTHEGTRVSLIQTAIMEYQGQAEYQQLPPEQRQALELILDHFLASVSGNWNRYPLGFIISQLTNHSTPFSSNLLPESSSSFFQSTLPQPQSQTSQISGAAVLPNSHSHSHSHSQGQNPTSPFSQFTFDGDMDAEFIDLSLLPPGWSHNSMS